MDDTPNADPQPEPEPDPITPEQAGKLLKANFKNLEKKVNAGGKLSASNLNLLQSIQAGGKGSTANFAKNQSELAEILGVNRKTVQRHLKRDNNPGVKPDGRMDVNAWRDFIGASGDDADEDAISVTYQRARNILLKNQRIEFDMETLRKNYLPRTVGKRVLTQLINAAKTRSFSGIARLVTLIRLAADTNAACEVARSEMVEIWTELERCEWFESNPK